MFTRITMIYNILKNDEKKKKEEENTNIYTTKKL